jgi:hypothetical protein
MPPSARAVRPDRVDPVRPDLPDRADRFDRPDLGVRVDPGCTPGVVPVRADGEKAAPGVETVVPAMPHVSQ